jgi:hypothetical protein
MAIFKSLSWGSYEVLLYCSTLLHCVDVTLLSTFGRLFATSVNILPFVVYHYMFRPSQPSLGVQVVMKESAALLYCCSANNQRQLHKKSRRALQWAAGSFIVTTCTPDDGQLGRNKKWYKIKRWRWTEVKHRRQKVECRILKYNNVNGSKHPLRLIWSQFLRECSLFVTCKFLVFFECTDPLTSI